MNKTNVAIPAICAVAGVAVGFIGGFFFAKAKYKKLYEEKADNEIVKYMKEHEVEGTKPTPDEAKEIAKNFPTETWSKAFEEQQAEKKEYKNILRDEDYISEDKEPIDPAEKEHPTEDENTLYATQKEAFEEQLNLFSEYSGISKSELLSGGVQIIDADEFFADKDEIDYEQYQWSPDYSELRNIDGEIMVPEILLGPEYSEILQKVEESPIEATYIHDERLDHYFSVELESPRHIK